MIQHPFYFHKGRGKEGRSFVQLCYTRSRHYALATFNGLQYPQLDALVSPVIKIKYPEILYITSFVPIIPIVFCVTYGTNTSKISSQKFFLYFYSKQMWKCVNGFTENSISLPSIDPWLFSLPHKNIGFHHSTQWPNHLPCNDTFPPHCQDLNLKKLLRIIQNIRSKFK